MLKFTFARQFFLFAKMTKSCVECDSVVMSNYDYRSASEIPYYESYAGLDHYDYVCCSTTKSKQILAEIVITVSVLVFLGIILILSRKQLSKVSLNYDAIFFLVITEICLSQEKYFESL